MSTRLRKSLRVLRVVAIAAPLISSPIVLHWNTGATVKWMLIVIALLLAIFQLINSLLTRVELGHCKIKGLAPVLHSEFYVGCLLPALIALLAFLLPPTPLVLLILGLLFGLTHLLYEPIEERIFVEVEKSTKRHGTTRFEEYRPLTALHIDEDIRTQVERSGKFSLWRGLRIFTGPPRRPRLSRTRTVVLAILLVALLLAVFAAASQFIRHHSGGDRSSGTPHRHQPSTGTGAVGEAAADVAEAAGEKDSVPCSRMPGDGAPAWAEDDLNSLYLGEPQLLDATEPPGTAIGGCTSRVREPLDPHGHFVYVVGHNPAGEVRSVAVDSFEFGPAIFLAPAAQRVLALIHSGEAPLGAYPIVDAGGGDMVSVLTPRGTYVLLRSEKHLPEAPAYATPYIQLAPPLAAAWSAAMRESRSWFWPHQPERDGGEEVFGFSPESHTRERSFSVSYDPAAQVARRGPYEYREPQPQLSRKELETYAAAAPP